MKGKDLLNKDNVSPASEIEQHSVTRELSEDVELTNVENQDRETKLNKLFAEEYREWKAAIEDLENISTEIETDIEELKADIEELKTSIGGSIFNITQLESNLKNFEAVIENQRVVIAGIEVMLTDIDVRTIDFKANTVELRANNEQLKILGEELKTESRALIELAEIGKPMTVRLISKVRKAIHRNSVKLRNMLKTKT